jgi:hypothetical protein
MHISIALESITSINLAVSWPLTVSIKTISF